jgi:hypothetical protein
MIAITEKQDIAEQPHESGMGQQRHHRGGLPR